MCSVFVHVFVVCERKCCGCLKFLLTFLFDDNNQQTINAAHSLNSTQSRPEWNCIFFKSCNHTVLTVYTVITPTVQIIAVEGKYAYYFPRTFFLQLLFLYFQLRSPVSNFKMSHHLLLSMYFCS